MYYSGFQSNSFQSNAFQIKRIAGDPDRGAYVPLDKYSYKTPHQAQREIDYQRRKLERGQAKLAALQEKIAEVERKRKQEIALLRAKKFAAERKALEAELLAEINLLLKQQAALIQLIKEEEAILIILMVMKRRRFRVV
jgi:hypothetical protein